MVREDFYAITRIDIDTYRYCPTPPIIFYSLEDMIPALQNWLGLHMGLRFDLEKFRVRAIADELIIEDEQGQKIVTAQVAYYRRSSTVFITAAMYNEFRDKPNKGFDRETAESDPAVLYDKINDRFYPDPRYFD